MTEVSNRSTWKTGARRWLRRGLWEMIATIIIALGVVMLMQPVFLTLYTYSFVTLLVGTALFTVATKFPE
ncbi:MAG TPA: hypothetical protein VGM59_09035 [Dongiaceae bacterium]